jgi:hypothetical protein
MAKRRYSDRKQIAETGSLGDVLHERVPEELATAMRVIIESADQRVADRFRDVLNGALMEHLGRGAGLATFYTGGDNVDEFIDAVEILAETGRNPIFVPRATTSGGRGDSYTPIPDVEERINRAFERFRFGYKMQDLEVHKIGSPALEVAIVGPALLAIQRPGWEEVERSFREAIDHQRGGEVDDALTAANAAVEAALKAIGMSGATLKELARSFKGSGLVPGYLENVPALLEDFLHRLHALRSQEGDAHGKGPGAIDPGEALADLAVHLAGSFIVYLAAVVPSADAEVSVES